MSCRKYVPSVRGQRRGLRKLGIYDLPACRVALQVLALPFQQSGADLLGREMILAWIMDLLRGTQRNRGVYECLVVGYKVYPLLVLGHGDGPVAKLLDDAIGVVGLALEDASVGVVGLLDLAHDNRLKLAARALKVEVRLEQIRGGKDWAGIALLT